MCIHIQHIKNTHTKLIRFPWHCYFYTKNIHSNLSDN
ncbi:unnamed protein product, partial [Callosobruchus maculatus]